MTPFADFHAHLSPFLRGETTAEELERQLGKSPSGTRRLAFYRVLMRRNAALILRRFHLATKNAVERCREGLWEEIVDGLARERPPNHFDPNRFGEGLSDYLAERREQDPSLPSYLEEIADYQWILYRAGVERFTASAEDIGMDRTLFVRQYEHDVPRFVREVKSDAEARLPEPASTLVIVYRHVRSLRARTYVPSPAELVALARRAGRPTKAPGITKPMLKSAVQQLRKQGILPPARPSSEQAANLVH